MSEAQFHQELGYLRGKLEALEGSLATVRGEQRSQGEKIDEVHNVLMQAKGGWRAMVMVGSVSAAVGALVAKLIPLSWR